MQRYIRVLKFALLACLAIGLSASANLPAGDPAPPNWKGSAAGSTTLVDIYFDGSHFHRVDHDTFGGESTHLGRSTGDGCHDLNLTTFQFVGSATWTAANGDTLNVTYYGQLSPPMGSPGPGPYPYGAYPFSFVGTLVANGGTGRFADANGQADWSGGFAGDGSPNSYPVPVPGAFFFDFDGTLDLIGN